MSTVALCMSTKYECANSRYSLRHDNTGYQLISRVVCRHRKTTRTSPLFKQSLIGLNEDETDGLNFSTIPYHVGRILLQSYHFVVVPRVFVLN